MTFMPINYVYAAVEPTREHVDALPGVTVVEFGAPWCGFCHSTQPLLAQALFDHPNVRHLKIEDARGKRLGRSYRVKLWPTLVFLLDGRELARLVRPSDTKAIRDALAQITKPLHVQRHAG